MKKLRIAQSMMIGTIVLIAAFQAYWLLKLYNDEWEGLKKETDVVFREVVYKLQVERFKKDTLTFRRFGRNSIDENLFNIEAVNVLKNVTPDEKPRRQISIITREGPSSIRVFSPSKHFPDSLAVNFIDTSKKEVKTHFFQLPEQLQASTKFPPLTRVQKSKTTIPKGPDDIFKINDEGLSPSIRFLSKNEALNDSLPLAQIDSAYKKELKKAAVNISFTVRKSSGEKSNIKEAKKELKTNPASVGFLSPYFYKASFYNPGSFIINKIAPLIILSLLLVAFTIGSFVVLYRNLIAQRRLANIKNEFISNITHELKTPIATVNVAIEALKSFNALHNPERTQEYLNISASELQRLSLLVDKVLRLSMFENKEIKLEKEWFNLEQLVKEVMVTMKLQFEKQKADFTLEATGENFEINADKLHITSVVYNLLDNALKYSKHQPKIDVNIISHPEYPELRISDNGVGIATEYKTKIFYKFFRVPTGDRHNIKGYGLGLSYVNDILKRHHGFIEVESEPGKGSTFIVKLPYKEAPVITYDNNRRIIKKEFKFNSPVVF